MRSTSVARSIPVRLGLALAAFAAFLALAPPVPGQVYVVHQIPGNLNNSSFGWAVAGIGDANADGVPDFAIGAPSASPSGVSCCFAGQITLHSGATGAVFTTISGSVAGARLGGSLVGLGDLDGDGKGDFAAGMQFVSATLPYEVRVYSGGSGSLLYTLTGPAGSGFGSSLAPAGDVTGDGKTDLLVGAQGADAPGLPFAGQAFVHSGANGAPVWTFNGLAVGELLGFSVAGPGDLNGDLIPDLLVGAPTAVPPGAVLARGQVRAFSGATGAPLFTLNGSFDDENFGGSVARAGDVDADGVPDFVVDAPFYALLPAGTPIGRTLVYSGANNAILHTFTGVTQGCDQNPILGGEDLTGDGVLDLVIGRTCLNSLRVYSTPGWNPLATVTGPAGHQLGRSLASVGDVDADGYPDFLAGLPQQPLVGQARVYSFAGVPAGSSLYGTGCAGSGGFVPQIRALGGVPSLGNSQFALSASKTLGGAGAFLVLGVSSTAWGPVPLPFNLGILGLPACSLLASVDVLFTTAATGAGAGGGSAILPAPIPNDPVLAGGTVYCQWAIADTGVAPLPVAMTRGIQLVILP